MSNTYAELSDQIVHLEDDYSDSMECGEYEEAADIYNEIESVREELQSMEEGMEEEFEKMMDQ